MTELILNVENESILPSLKKVLSSLAGVTVKKAPKRKKGSLEMALEDIEAGRVYSAKDGSDLIRKCLE